MPSVSLKLVMGIMVAIVAIVPSTIAFVPIYLVGVDSVSDTAQLVRQTSVARATERTVSTFTYPQRALYALESAVTAGLLNLSLTNLTTADITRLNNYIAQTLFGDPLAMATTFTILIRECRYFAFASRGAIPLLVQYNDAVGQYDAYVAFPNATGQIQLTFAQRTTETGSLWDDLNNFSTVRALDAQKDTAARWVPTLIDGTAQPQLVAGFPFRGGAGLTGFVWFDVSTDFISPFLQTLGLGGNYRAMIIHRASRVVIGNSWDEAAFDVIGANDLRRRMPSDFNDTLVRRVVSHFGGNQQMVDAQLPYSSTTGSGADVVFIDATHISDGLGLDVMLVVAIPEKDYLGNVYTTRWVVIGSVLGAVVVVIVLGIVFAILIVRPIDDVSGRMDRTARLEADDDTDASISVLSEVRAMQRSYHKMKEQLALMKRYLPPSVLATLIQEHSADSDSDAEVNIDNGNADADEEGSVAMSASYVPASSFLSSNLHTDVLTGRSVRYATSNESSSVRSDTSRSVASRSRHKVAKVGSTLGSKAKAVAPNMALSLGTRRIAVIALNVSGWHGILRGHCRGAPEKYERILSGYLEAVSRRVKEGRGVLDMFQGDRVFASFNAVATTPAFTRRAITAAYDVRSDLLPGGGEMPALQVTAGISVGNATVGNAGTADMLKFTITGHVYSEAVALERYGRTTFKQGGKGAGSDFTPTDARLFAPDVGFTATPIMIPGMAMQEVENHYILQAVDVVELRRMQTIKHQNTNYVAHLETSDQLCNSFQKDAVSTPTAANIVRQRGFHRAIVASVEKCIKTNGVDADEWMYEIEQLRDSNPYATTNSAFAAILRGEGVASDVLEMFDGGGGSVASSVHTNNTTSPVSMDLHRSTSPGSRRISHHNPFVPPISPPDRLGTFNLFPQSPPLVLEDTASESRSPPPEPLTPPTRVAPTVSRERLLLILRSMKPDTKVGTYSKKIM